MIVVRDGGRALEVSVRDEVIRIEAWGEDSLRVRVARHRILDDLPGALVPAKPSTATATADDREPWTTWGPDGTGGPNEVWSYGEQALGVIERTMRLRERLRPYLEAQMRVAHERGIPPMRPLFVDFSDDERAWTVEDQFLVGPDVLVAPILESGGRQREVYLPAGARWADARTGEAHGGGEVVSVAAPLERIPVFLRDGAEVPIRG